VTGKTSRYKVKHDGYGAELINSIRPSELFRQPFLRIQSGKSGSLFVMNQVETIRFITPIMPELQAQPPAKDPSYLLSETFHGLILRISSVSRLDACVNAIIKDIQWSHAALHTREGAEKGELGALFEIG